MKKVIGPVFIMILLTGCAPQISQNQNIGIDDTSDKNVTQPQTKTSSTIKFIAYDDPPMPIGGYGAIYENIVYPKIAQMAGTEGKVIIQAFIDDKGRVQEMNVLEGIADSGLNEAAMAAIKKTRFKPAQHRNQPVGVYISIPVNFKLKE
jgi:protein TonB